VDDVYPEAMIASEVLPENSFWIRGFRHLNKWLYQNVDKIIVLGRDMERLVRSKMSRNRDRISVIHNWADLETITPSLRASNRLLVDLHIEDKFVIQCAGNMGRVQGIETMFRAAEILKDDGRVHFLFIGNGAKRKWMEEEVSAKGLKNVTLLGFRPRSEQNDFLNACDISMASLVAGMVGAGVPSRMYNVMAAGKPLIAVADPDSELSLVVEEERIGWVVPSGEPARLVDAILDAISDKGRLGRMGESARKSVENKYTADHALVQYLSLIQNRSTAACRANPL